MWDERYAVEDYVYGTEPSGVLIRRNHWLKPGAKTLCVADGEGRNSVYLAQQGLKVTAFDGAAAAVDKARRLAAGRGVEVEYSVQDVFDWDWPVAEFHLVVGIFIQFVGPEGRAMLFDKMKQALKPGGVLLLHGYTPRQLQFGTGGPGVAENLYTAGMLRKAFADMQVQVIEDYELDIREGRGHVGRSALIDLIAVKR
ncbi:SAM-dependent methyltransferase [Salipiger mangrovisoli]|uniref:Class I SAM-dependent methyltransferase n=1 Tax=Salipiger mangrovisoli TaxID=2865933 RepID=A0ABR9XA57_9RHOB|nr:class I SAM-dependent methyltransferase [Salipiger mangrovisoli]MBE9640398.1 class I SAM-dependent methyltransferase [Salipiger mangrovisoli]